MPIGNLLDSQIAEILGQPKELKEESSAVTEDELLAALPAEARAAFEALKKKPEAEPEKVQNLIVHHLDDPPIDYDKMKFGHALNFRGRPDAIIDRLRWFQGIARRAFKLTAGRPCIDLAAGRGEWLVLCKRDGIPAVGVEESAYNVEVAQAQLLDVKQGEWINLLREQKDGRIGMVAAFRLFEYLQPIDHATIVTHALRVLAPNGVLMIETPNIEHPRVREQWDIDPWRRKPAHPLYLTWLCKYFGFDKVEPHRINNGGEDFALIAHKAA